jgi:ppGpp synthetase/RelA/SpoT-type nucleotidyltranferase
MVEFLKDTKDIIEKHYGKKILTNYPKYKEIWEDIIGVRKVNGFLLPWDIDFSESFLFSL